MLTPEGRAILVAYVREGDTLKPEVAAALQTIDRLREQRDVLMVAVKCLLDSAAPRSSDQPAMAKAWVLATQILDKVERSEEG